MGRYFDYSDWHLDELCEDLRKRISESKKPLPKKVRNRYVSIYYRIGEGSWMYPNTGWFAHGTKPDFKSVKEAEEYLDSLPRFKKIGDNSWVEGENVEYYTCQDGTCVPKHYEVKESYCMEYEDGEGHIEYSKSEQKMLRKALYEIEKARVYMDVYDHCCDQWSFGEGHFSKELTKRLKEFEENYTEDFVEEE